MPTTGNVICRQSYGLEPHQKRIKLGTHGYKGSGLSTTTRQLLLLSKGLKSMECTIWSTQAFVYKQMGRQLDRRQANHYISELQISFWVNWVFTQPDYSQLHTCKINSVFLFLPHVFFKVTNNVHHVFLTECSHREVASIYLFTHNVCLSRPSN